MTCEGRLELDPVHRYHLMGVGGVGMSGLAGILAERGFRVSGSDNRDSNTLQRLRNLGVTTVLGQVYEGAEGADVVVISTAIRPDNPELVGAQERGQPIYHRSQLLAAVMDGQRKIAVSGTHGKTTTTALLGQTLVECGFDPTVIVGGDVPALGGNYRLGSTPLVVFEACESDGTFIRYGPCSELITNLEPDHLDQHGTYENLCRTFDEFMGLAPDDGFLAYGCDSPELAAMAAGAPGRHIPFGFDGCADLSATDIQVDRFGVSFRVLAEGDEGPTVRLNIPGRHNVLNALGVLAAARELGVPLEQAAAALANFRGVERRFELLGSFRDALVVDDYAHHPTEVAAALVAAREGFDRRLIAVFQPHLFSRTRDFLEEFARALTAADVVIMTGIYAAREDPMPGVSAAGIADRVRELAPDKLVEYVPDKDDIVAALGRIVQPEDLILTLGAGDIRRVAERLAQEG